MDTLKKIEEIDKQDPIPKSLSQRAMEQRKRSNMKKYEERNVEQKDNNVNIENLENLEDLAINDRLSRKRDLLGMYLKTMAISQEEGRPFSFPRNHQEK